MASYASKSALLVVLGFFISSFALVGATPAVSAPLRAQAEVLELARTEPASSVNLIVQTNDSAAVEAAVAGLGGVVTQRLDIIRSLAVRLPAANASALAAHPAARWVSLDAPVASSESRCQQCLDTSSLVSTYVKAINADRLWNERPGYLQGQGVTVAVVDSGIYESEAFSWSPNGDDDDELDVDDGDDDGDNDTSRIIARVKFNSNAQYFSDRYGHGSHVAGIIGGNGRDSNGRLMGVAPRVNLINVKVSDDQGAASIADVVAGLQWVYENKDAYNIRVVNISLNSSVSESYHTSPLNAAVEILWFSGIVVVVSAGNNGASQNGILYPPANDPFVISVGATNDFGTPGVGDDALAGYSAYGTTESGFSKPDLLAPGTNIVSLKGYNTYLSQRYPSHNAGSSHFRMSGTSMAAAVTTGAIALLLQDEPHLTPDQVKHRLIATGRPIAMGPIQGRYLDIYAAVHGTTTASSNTGIAASQLLWSGSQAPAWGSVSWNSVSWNSVSWNSVSWNSVSWNSVSWNSVSWDP